MKLQNVTALALTMLVSASLVAADSGLGASNTYGVMKVVSASTRTLVSVPWCKSSSVGGRSISAADLVKTANLTEGDMLHIYRNDGFDTWVLVRDSEEVLRWESVKQVSQNGVANDTEPADEAAVAQGGSFMLSRQNPLDGGGQPLPFYLMGQVGVSATAISTVVCGTAETPCCNLIAAPCAEAVNVITKVTGMQDGDEIVAPSGTLQITYTYIESQSGWCVLSYSRKGYVWQKVDAINVPMGQGFWYVSRSVVSPAPKFTWDNVPVAEAESK